MINLRKSRWNIVEVAVFQHFINASNNRENTLIFITRGNAAILVIRSLHAAACLRNALSKIPKNRAVPLFDFTILFHFQPINTARS